MMKKLDAHPIIKKALMFKLYTGVKNQIDEPSDFILWKSPEKELPQNICEMEDGTFRVVIIHDHKKIHDSRYDTEEEALIARNKGYKIFFILSFFSFNRIYALLF